MTLDAMLTSTTGQTTGTLGKGGVSLVQTLR